MQGAGDITFVDQLLLLAHVHDDRAVLLVVLRLLGLDALLPKLLRVDHLAEEILAHDQDLVLRYGHSGEISGSGQAAALVAVHAVGDREDLPAVGRAQDLVDAEGQVVDAQHHVRVGVCAVDLGQGLFHPDLGFLGIHQNRDVGVVGMVAQHKEGGAGRNQPGKHIDGVEPLIQLVEVLRKPVVAVL